MPKLGEFLTQFGRLESDLAQAGISWPELEEIGARHLEQFDELRTTAEYIAARLRTHASVHSVKSRVKNPAHLLEKVVRKCLVDKTRKIDRQSYRDEITDLIGIRVLHLFKGEWIDIHRFITSCWDLAEPPTANIRRGDSETVAKAFSDAGCSINEHPQGYRSVHYLVKSSPSRRVHIAELQVRTIFEEGWSEIDHTIRYPYNLDNPVLNQFLAVFNNLAGSADEMGTFIRTLHTRLSELDTQRAREAADHARAIEELQAEIKQLKIDSGEKAKLETRVKQLEARSAGASRVDMGGPIVSGTVTINDQLASITKANEYMKSFMMPANLGFGGSGAITFPRHCKTCGKEIQFGGLLADDLCATCRARGPITTR